MRFEAPNGVVFFLIVWVVGGLLLSPRIFLMIVLLEALVKFAGDASDDFALTGIGHAQATRSESSDPLAGLDEDDAFSHAGGLDCSCDARRGAAVDDDIALDVRGLGEGGEEESQGNECGVHWMWVFYRKDEKV